MYSVEDILRQQVAKDNEFRQDVGQAAMLGGAGLGALHGMMNGKGVRGRMAGGLVGGIVTGALGAGATEAILGESKAAQLLSKLQVQGTLNTAEAYELENIMKNAYQSGMA